MTACRDPDWPSWGARPLCTVLPRQSPAAGARAASLGRKRSRPEPGLACQPGANRAVEGAEARLRRSSREEADRERHQARLRDTLQIVFVVHGTKKFLDRVAPSPPLEPTEQSTTRLGAWYAAVLFWPDPQVALFVNELTLLPLLVPLAPAATVINRMPHTATAAFTALGLMDFIALELAEMSQHRVVRRTTAACSAA